MDHMFETHRFGTKRIISIVLILVMALPAAGTGASGPGDECGAAPRVTDDAKDLIVPNGETYELSGCHTYTSSVQINGTLKVKPYDGTDATTGSLTLQAKWIIIGAGGSIVADGRGFGGGGGASERATGGGKGGVGGKGGDGDTGASNGGGGGGGSNGGQGGAKGTLSTTTAGTQGTETGGGTGGKSYLVGGAGGTGFGAGGGGGGGDYPDGGGGGGGGSGGTAGSGDAIGGNGAGPAKGMGGSGFGIKGADGGYAVAGINGDTSTDMSILKGSGGGGATSRNSSPFLGGGGGGGAGGGSVALVSEGNIVMDGRITTTGGGGGFGGGDDAVAPAGGGGAGGGILLFGLNAAITGSLDARGRQGNVLSTTNGGTVKIYYETDQSGSATIQAGRTYKNGRPKMQGLIAPGNGSIALLRPELKWNAATDPESEPVTYHLQVSAAPAFSTLELDKQGISGTQYASDKDLIGVWFYWRVRARDAVGNGSWSPVWRFMTDNTPPASQVAALPKYTTRTNFTVSWAGADDSSGIATYDILVAEGTGALSFVPWLTGIPESKTSASFEGKDGHMYSFYSVATDHARNRETDPDQADTSTTIDATPPVTTMSSLTPYQGSLSFKLSWSSKDATSGVQYYNVFMAEGDGLFELYQEHTTKTTVQFDADDGREYRFYVVACDIAGNWEATPAQPKILRTKVDLTPPEVSLRLGTPNTGMDPVFVTTATPVYIDATDNFAGVNGTFFIIDDRGVKAYAGSIKESAPGFHNMSYWSTDKAGNKGDAGSLWFFVDAEPPQTSFSCEGANRVVGDKAFVTTSTSIVLGAVDVGSGINWIEYNLDKRGFVHFAAPLKFSSGTHSLLYRSVDKVGNVETEKSVTVVVDTTSPNTGPEGDYSTVSNTDLTITLGVTDTESGVAGTFFRVVREKGKAGDYQAGNTVLIEAGSDGSEDANYTIQYYSVDNVNNVERVKELKVRIDTRVALQLGFTNEPSVTDSSYLLEGKTEPGAKMTVGVNDVQLSADGSFAHELSLKPGKNKVVITITDPAGNALTKTVYITYNEPLTTVGWFLPLVIVVIIAAAAGAGVFIFKRRSKTPPPAKPRQAPARIPATPRVRAPPPRPPKPPMMP